ncbi:hypothetical protein [Algoriphagus hitonicola]|uniref:Uncharacterized protein n=1 Tax=Algoriphagus hitonicola TaxID=435880 RepID=A0A1I2VPE9_9BACT|nr:hypothetical protein [Algoriphagus hitonicola]SFG91042.1 hypothetical protein SAMN04487988_11067 [Algoriphagus hitonicola]
MNNSSTQLNLDLWKDEQLIRKQNRLKYQFWELLGKVGDHFEQEELKKIHAPSRGKKLSQGSDLMGLPYQVLDIIRDFDLEKGLNIRILNWFGKGLYLFVLLGKENFGSLDLGEQSFQKCNWDSPWEYEKLIVSNEKLALDSDPGFFQWYKEIPVFNLTSKNEIEWVFQIKKLTDTLSQHLGIQEI